MLSVLKHYFFKDSLSGPWLLAVRKDVHKLRLDPGLNFSFWMYHYLERTSVMGTFSSSKKHVQTRNFIYFLVPLFIFKLCISKMPMDIYISVVSFLKDQLNRLFTSYWNNFLRNKNFTLGSIKDIKPEYIKF